MGPAQGGPCDVGPRPVPGGGSRLSLRESPDAKSRGKELLYAAQGIYNRTYEQMFPLVGTAAIYLVLVIILSWLLGKLERRLRQSDRR